MSIIFGGCVLPCFVTVTAYFFRTEIPLTIDLLSAYITFCDSTTIRLRYDYDTTIPRRIRLRRKSSKLRFDCVTTTIRLRRKIYTFIFFACVELEAGARDTS